MPVKRLLSVAALLISIGTLSAQATVRYVNKDSACPGNGATGTPYCSIQNAVSAAVAGDDIRIRKASTAYNENVSTQSAGISGSPITIESDDHANQPIWYYLGNGSTNGALQIGHSYWTVQYLDFDGTGIFTSRLGIWITGPSSGVKILHNTIKNWGGTMAQRGTTFDVSGIAGGGHGPVIQNNLFDGVARFGIESSAVDNALIDSNEFKNAQCGHSSGDQIITNGIHIIDANDNGTLTFSNTISNNTFHDFQDPSSCTIGAVGDMSGIHVDVGPINGTIQGNTVFNLDPSHHAGGASVGIWLEQKSFGWTVQNNIVYNIGDTGIKDNTQESDGCCVAPARTNIYHNTVYNIQNYGLQLFGYENVQNNIFMNGLDGQIYVDAHGVIRGNMTIGYNDYYDGAGGHIGVWNGSSPFSGLQGTSTLSAWQTACGCDSHSINANPLFVNPPSDFHLQSGSLALTAGIGGTYIGALAAAALPNISSLTASPSLIFPPQSSMLAWNTSGATSLSIDQGIGTVTGTTSKSVTPSSTTIYTLTATNSNGSVTAKTTVAIAPPVISSFTANPVTISAGQSSTLSWSVTGATSLSIDQGIGTITGTSHAVSPTTTTTYTLTASNIAGSTTAKVSVTVGAVSSSSKASLILE